MESGIDEEWVMVDYYPPSKQKPQIRWSWVIDAGKKVVIGGLVVSSLPFILPPLVVISALGLALSVPYGVVLASYACTHKLMTKLLPSNPTQFHRDELETGFEDIKQIGDDEIRREVEKEEGYHLEINKDDDDVERVNEEEQKEEGDTTDDKSFFKDEKTHQIDDHEIRRVVEKEGEGYHLEINKDDDVERVNEEGDTRNEKSYFNVEKTHQVDDEIKRKEEEEGYNLDRVNEKEEKEESDTKPYLDVVKTKEEENVSQEEIITETKGGEVKQNGTNEILVQDSILTQTKRDEEETENSVHDKIITQDEQQNKESGKRRRKKKSGGAKSKEAPLIVEETVIVVEDESSKANVDEVIQEKIEVVMAQDDLVTVKSTTIIVDAELKEEEKHIEEDQPQEAFGDEKIWAKIDAIREISGFNSPRRDSYYEELKALYLFTGIEAPSTSSHTPPDFPEFYSKLCFLMSVIGLK